MTRKIRKQIYIEQEQHELLKRRSSELSISQSALVREYISEGLRRPAQAERQKAWKEALASMEERAKMRVPQTGRTWTRDELYDERFKRYDH